MEFLTLVYAPCADPPARHVKIVEVRGSPPSAMATCPKCLGPLTDNHKCRSGRLRRVTDALATTAVGGLVGWIVVLMIDERPAGALIVAAAALGAVLASAVRQAIHGPIR
jgi:hypothetical protein